MYLRALSNQDDAMEPVLHMAGLVITKCHSYGLVLTHSTLQCLLFYIQGWHLALPEDRQFDAEPSLKGGFDLFPAVVEAYGNYKSKPIPISAGKKAISQVEDNLIISVLESYGRAPDNVLKAQADDDLTAVRHISAMHYESPLKAMRIHFCHLATPEILRANRLHGSFIDIYRAKKYQAPEVAGWSPPADPTPEELAEFDLLASA
jgi:uncharacterized phage-associated protein